MTPTQRQPHAILDRDSRLLKARKIAELLAPYVRVDGAALLDIGTGSGFMAAELAELGARVHAVDVADQRQIFKGFEFTRVDGTALPFPDARFDVVLSNHVIEHVGSEADELHHLREVNRVLKPGGVCYLAVPNRWVLVEPHFKLPFLSWLPERLRSPYVRLARKGAAYDCDLPTRRKALRLFREAGFEATELTVEAMRVMARVERPPAPLRRLLEAPEPVLKALLPVNPTMIFLLRKSR